MDNVGKADPDAGIQSPGPHDGLQAWRSRSCEGSRLGTGLWGLHPLVNPRLRVAP